MPLLFVYVMHLFFIAAMNPKTAVENFLQQSCQKLLEDIYAKKYLVDQANKFSQEGQEFLKNDKYVHISILQFAEHLACEIATKYILIIMLLGLLCAV